MSIAHVEQPKKRRRAALGPHTREHRLLEGVDWRTREGHVLKAARDELTAHVGGNPNNVQKALIERAARLTLYIELMDARAIAAGTMTAHDSRSYLAWVNALRLCLREIGLDEAKPAKAASIASIVARHAVKPLVSMRSALSDDDLLGKALKGDSWSAWRIILIAAMGEVLTDAERLVWRELTGGRQREPGVMAEEVHAICGRRSGKTKAVATAAVYLAALCDHSDKLAAGERAVLPIMSATTWQSSRAFNFIRGIFSDAPALQALVESGTADTIRLANVDIECRPASYRTIRGATAVGFVADETAFWWTAEAARNPDVEIFNAARPALATTGGPLLCVTSPYGKRGEAWATFRRDFGPEGDPRVVVINAASRRLNPTLSESVVKRAFERDAAAARSEFGGEFRNDISGFIDLAVIEGAVDRGVTARPRLDGVVYRSGCDMNGGAHDSATICVAHDEDEVRFSIALWKFARRSIRPARSSRWPRR